MLAKAPHATEWVQKVFMSMNRIGMPLKKRIARIPMARVLISLVPMKVMAFAIVSIFDGNP